MRRSTVMQSGYSFVLTGLVLASSVAWAQSQDPANETYEVMALPEVMIAARDGIQLATNVYLPGSDGQIAEGRFPTIVERTPYDKNVTDPTMVEFFVSRGYAVVVQDVRGRYASQGSWRPLRDDGPDGVDLLAWIGDQPWSNGRVGTMGTSYPGGTQHALAIANAPELAAMVPIDAMSNYGRFGIRHNGAFELRFFNWVLTLGNPNASQGGPIGLLEGRGVLEAATRAASDPAGVAELQALSMQVRELVTMLPLLPGTTALRHAPDYESWLIEAMRHGDYDDFWKDMGSSVIDHVAEYQDVPVLHVTGWYDSWGAQVANMNYVELSQAKESPQQLLIGPWTHGGQTSPMAGIARFGPQARISRGELHLRWFDRWLKGVENGVENDAPVRIFVMGGGNATGPAEVPAGQVFVGGYWRDENEWPLARAVETPYYLHSNGTLSPEPPDASAPSSYQFDPRNPVPTIGGNVSSEGALMLRGPQDQRCRPEIWLCRDSLPLSARPDVLVFQTPPLEADMEVTGPLVVKLWASSDGPDTDFTAKLIDVYPPSEGFPEGVDLNIGDSIVRARYRDSLETAKPLVPGEAVELTIEMYPTSLVFKRGHRIRVDISSSNFPRFDVNPNTGEPLNQNETWRVAENTIYHDPEHPSRILLPIIPAD